MLPHRDCKERTSRTSRNPGEIAFYFIRLKFLKDEECCSSLSEEQRSQLPENPAGTIELSDEDMESVAGGWGSYLACGGIEYCSISTDFFTLSQRK